MLILYSYSYAQVPQLINYQGKLTKFNGAPLDTTISMVFSIYADSAGTILKWAETQGAVVVEKGIFNVLLGNVNPIPDTVFSGNIRYLGVKVGGDPEITPRKPMVSVPYAYRSATGAGDNDWTINGDTIYHLTGNVGIGTTTPNEQLELTGNLRLPPSTASAGVIKSGADRFIHNFGTNNFFAGVNAGNFSLSGSNNTGVGWNALLSLTTGFSNTAVGRSALLWNATGSQNTAVGLTALVVNSTGGSNTAVGQSALSGNTTGGGNTAVGLLALISNSTGMYNTAIGYQANVSAGGLTNATAIGYNAVVDASNKVRIGNTAVTSIGGQVGWTAFSDGRYKRSVSENVPGLAFISKLKPVTYTLDVDAIDAALKPLRKPREGQTEDAFKLTAEEIASKQVQSQIVYTGFIAQEVEKAARETGYDFSGVDAPKNAEGMYGLRYAEFVVPLVKAVQEQQQTIKEQQEQIKMLEQRVAELEKK